VSNLPKKCLVDTNVPIVANQSLQPSSIPKELIQCVFACVEAIEHVVNNGGLVIDAGDEIYSEYRQHLSLKGQPGIGDRFMKWVHDNRWTFPVEDRVSITRNGVSYDEFPSHVGLTNFDNSDRMFVAVANKHPNKPTILEATDSKWWGWQDALNEVGISVKFLCPEYVRKKYEEKFGT
jgi:hypothetical protein